LPAIDHFCNLPLSFRKLDATERGEFVADSYIADHLRLGACLEELLMRGGILMISRYDGDYHAEYSGPLGVRRKVAPMLVDCIEELTDNPRRKVCRREGCIFKGTPLPFSKFTPDKDSSDGHASVCKDCESKRIKKHNDKKKKEKEKT
jgi:hypothetical protein